MVSKNRYMKQGSNQDFGAKNAMLIYVRNVFGRFKKNDNRYLSN